MTTHQFHRKMTAQTAMAGLLIIFGVVAVLIALYMPPRGEIHPSVIVVFGMVLTAAGAFLGIDLNFQFKHYLEMLKETQNQQRRTTPRTTKRRSSHTETPTNSEQ